MERPHSAIQMIKSLFADSPWHLQMIMLIVVMGISLIITSFLGMLSAMPIFGLSWAELETVLDHGNQITNTNLLKYLQGIQTLGLFIIPAILANYFFFPEGQGVSKAGLSDYLSLCILFLLTILFIIPFLSLIMDWNSSIRFPDSLSDIEQRLTEMEAERQAISQRMMKQTGLLSLLVNLLIIAVLPAIGEEYFFRGVLQKLFLKWINNRHLSVILAAIIFSAFHLQFYGFVPRLILGIYFGYLFLWSSNIFIPILAHFLNNAVAIILVFLSNSGTGIWPSWLDEGYSHQWAYMLISIGFTSLLLIVTRRLIYRIASRSISGPY